MALQEMVTGVSTLLKTVKDVESEAGKGVRSLENAIDAIEEAVKVMYYNVMLLLNNTMFIGL